MPNDPPSDGPDRDPPPSWPTPDELAAGFDLVAGRSAGIGSWDEFVDLVAEHADDEPTDPDDELAAARRRRELRRRRR